MATLQLYSGLKATQAEDAILLSGKTFDYKDLIKSIPGAKWDAQQKLWRLPLGSELSPLVPPPPSAAMRQAMADYYISDSYLRRVCGRTRHGQCCSEATTKLDDFNPQGPMWYVCTKHGNYKSDYDGT